MLTLINIPASLGYLDLLKPIFCCLIEGLNHRTIQGIPGGMYHDRHNKEDLDCYHAKERTSCNGISYSKVSQGMCILKIKLT